MLSQRSKQLQQPPTSNSQLLHTLHVSHVPEWLEDEEFSRHFSQLDGCVGCRLRRDQNRTKKGGFVYGFVDFDSKEAASAAKAIYAGWQGWDSRGLQIDFARSALRQPPPQQQQHQQRFPQDPRLSRASTEASPPRPMQPQQPQQEQPPHFQVPPPQQQPQQQQPFYAAAPLQLNQQQPQQPQFYQQQQQPPQQQPQPQPQPVFIATTAPGPAPGQAVQYVYQTQPPLALPQQGQHQQVVMAAAPPPMPGPPANRNIHRSLYITNLPHGIRPREVAHIFRPFPGYRGIRLIQKNWSRERGEREGHDIQTLCFIDFENPDLAAAAKDKLQGYALDLEDDRSPRLEIKYAFRDSWAPGMTPPRGGGGGGRDGGRDRRKRSRRR